MEATTRAEEEAEAAEAAAAAAQSASSGQAQGQGLNRSGSLASRAFSTASLSPEDSVSQVQGHSGGRHVQAYQPYRLDLDSTPEVVVPNLEQGVAGLDENGNEPKSALGRQWAALQQQQPQVSSSPFSPTLQASAPALSIKSSLRGPRATRNHDPGFSGLMGPLAFETDTSSELHARMEREGTFWSAPEGQEEYVIEPAPEGIVV